MNRSRTTFRPSGLSLRTLPASSVWLGFVMCMAAALRFFRLGEKSFCLDEAVSASLTRMDSRHFILAVVHRQANMVLYYSILRLWTKFAGSEFFLRSLSVVFGIAAIPITYLLGKQLFGRRAARVAAILIAVHAFHIQYSKEARSYSLLFLLAELSSLFFVQSLQRNTRKDWSAYILASVLMLHAHVLGCLVLLAQWLTTLGLRKNSPRRQLWLSVVTIAFLASPLAACLLLVSDRSQLAWMGRPSLNNLYELCLNLAGNGGPSLLLGYVSMAALAVVWAWVQAGAQPTGEMWKYWFLLTWLILPALALWAISFRSPMLLPRFLISCVAPLVLLAADGLSRIRSKVMFSAALTILLMLSMLGTFSYERTRANEPTTDDWRGAAGYLASHSAPGDAVFFIWAEEKIAFDNYARLDPSSRERLREYPENSDFELLSQLPPRPSLELLENVVAQCNRVWLISAFQSNSTSLGIETLLESKFSAHTTQHFGFVHTDLFGAPVTGSATGERSCR